MINNTYYNGKLPPKYFINNKQVKSMYMNNMLIYHLIPCTGIELNATEIVMTNTVNNSFTLLARVSPSNCNEELTFMSSDNDIATVDNNGVIRPKQIGICDIIVACGEISTMCKVNVKEEFVYLYNQGAVNNNSEFGQLVYPDNDRFSFAEDNLFINLAGSTEGYGSLWFSWSNMVELGEYDVLFMDITNTNDHASIVGMTRNNKANQQGYAEGQNTLIDGNTFIDDRTITTVLEGVNKHFMDVDQIIGSGYLGLYFKRDNTGGETLEDYINVNTIYLLRKSVYVIGSGVATTPEAQYPCTGLSFNKDIVEVVYIDQPVVYDLKDMVSVTPANCDEQIIFQMVDDGDGTINIQNNGVVNINGKGTAIVQAICGSYFDNIIISTRKPCEQIELNTYELTFTMIGDTETILATISPIDTTDKVVWKSTDENIAIVDQNGNITSVGIGQCIIYAECGAKYVTVMVSVGVACTGLSIDKSNCLLDLSNENTTSIVATVTPANTTDGISWISSDTNIAIVNNGVITGVNPGMTTIIVTCGTKSVSCDVIVKASCRELSLDISEYVIDTLYENIGSIGVIVVPENTTDELIWTSSDNNIISVENGVFTVFNTGSAVITATCGTKTASCNVTVKASCRELALDQPTCSLDLSGVKTTTLNPICTPNNTTDEIIWKTNNSSVVTVENGVVTAVAIGSAKITALCGNAIAVCDVNVVKSCTEISLDYSSYTLNISKYTAVTFTATISPADTTDELVWTTSNSNIATVSTGTNTTKGTVTVYRTGTVTITVTCGTKSADLNLTVIDSVPCTSITVSPKTYTINVGDFIAFGSEIYVSVQPSNCTDTVSYSTSNADVLDPSIAASGVYKGYSAGTATLTARCGSKSDSCTVTVIDPTVCTGISLSASPSTNIKVGERVAIYVTLSPSTCTQSYSYSCTGAIGEDGYAGVYKGLSVGVGTVTVRCGSITRSITINVTE